MKSIHCNELGKAPRKANDRENLNDQTTISLARYFFLRAFLKESFRGSTKNINQVSITIQGNFSHIQ